MLKEIFSKIFQTQSKTVSNAIIQFTDTQDSEQKGRHFKSRFIQPGLANYPESFGMVLITKETLDKFIQTMVGKPVIINHQDITADNLEEIKKGEVEKVWYNSEDGWYWCSGYINDTTAQNLITNKGWSVSCSYEVLTADDAGGTENNVKYDMEFLNGVFNHLALVSNPRYERANIVFNSKTVKNFNPYHNKLGQFCSEEEAIQKIKDSITPIKLSEYDVLKFERKRDLQEWAKEEFAKLGKITIEDTGIELSLSKESADREGIKRRSLQEGNRAVFSNFKDIVTKSKKIKFRKKDERHDRDQDVYYNKFNIGTKKFETEIFVDKPTQSDKKYNYAGHKATEIKVVPLDNYGAKNSLDVNENGTTIIITDIELNLNPGQQGILNHVNNWDENIYPKDERANISFDSKTVISNYNPNHDKEGKFCNGGNSTSFKEIQETEIYKNLDENLKKTVDFVYNTPPVAKLTGNEFQKDGVKLTDKVPEYYNKHYPNGVNNPILGNVKLDREGVKDSLGHKMSSAKAAAFTAVPNVIEKGYVFNQEKNWKNRGYDTAVIIAPIQIGDKDYICEVIVKQQSNRQGLYLHEVEISEKLADVLKTPTQGSTPTSSKLIIAKKISDLNPKEEYMLNSVNNWDENIYPKDERANISFDSKAVISNYNPDQPRVPKGNSNGGQFTKQNGNKTIKPKKRDYNTYLNKHKSMGLIEKYPPDFLGQTDEDIANFLGVKGNKPAIFYTPLETVKIYRNNFPHIRHETDKTRLLGLNRAIRTLQAPSLIIQDKEENYYIKFFNKSGKDKTHLQVIKTTKNGGFYKTNFPMSKNKFEKLEGQVIYDLSSKRGKTSTNSIPQSAEKLNPNIKENLQKADNNKGVEMELLQQFEDVINKIKNGNGVEAENEKTDKRRIIDEVGGILKGKVDEELWQTVIGKLEKIAYDKSEAGTTDNQKVSEDEEEYEKLKKEVKEDAQNKKKCNNAVQNGRTDHFEQLNNVYNQPLKAPEQTMYVSTADRLKAAEEYFKR